MRPFALVLGLIACGCRTVSADVSPAGAGDSVPSVEPAVANPELEGVTTREVAPDEEGLERIELPLVGLVALAPEGTEVSEMMQMDLIMGPKVIATVEEGDQRPRQAQQAIDEAKMYSPDNLTIQPLPDGYILTFTNEGSMGTNYWVQALREIDGKAYWCSTTAATREEMDNVVALCQSLRHG